MREKLNETQGSQLTLALKRNRLVKICEIIVIFISALSLIKILDPFVGDNLVLKQAVIWLANVLMLVFVWVGIKLRGQKLSDFGITFGSITWKGFLNVFLLSLLVFAAAIAAFILGSIVMVNITGMPQQADMSNYSYLQDSLFLFLLTLIGVYIVSSFGEEVIYRAFLINRLVELGLDRKAGRIAAIFVSALVFGLVHYEWGLMGVVQTGFMGLALGFFYLKLNKRIWILVLAHAYMDTILMMQMYSGG